MKNGTRRGARRMTARAKPAQPRPEADAGLITASAPARPELRAPLRDDDPRARAAARAAQLREHGSLDAGDDRFAIDPRVIPDGWGYEWKRNTVYGKEDPAYQVRLAQAGWEPVPVSRHPELMPTGWPGGVIERDGMILMERPKEIIDDASAADLRNARHQMQFKEEQLGATPQGQLPRDADPRTKPSIKRSYEPMQIPEG